MLNYLHQSKPRFNIFIGTRRVTWTSTAEIPVQPEGTSPTMAPVTALDAPAAGVVNNGSEADISNLDSVRIFMTLNYALNDRYTGERVEPSEEEWGSLLMATKKFLTQSLSDYYESDPDSDFIGLQAVQWNEKTFSEGEENPYAGIVQFDIAFMDGASLMPNSAYWTIINGFDFNDYLRHYEWLEPPSDSIFHYASRVDWNFVNSK